MKNTKGIEKATDKELEYGALIMSVMGNQKGFKLFRQLLKNKEDLNTRKK